MNAIQIPTEAEVKLVGDVDGETILTPEQRRNLCDPKVQEQYRAAYRLQQARLSCPGCGEYGLSF